MDFAHSQGKIFVVDIEEESLEVDIDLDILQRIIYNLLSNSLKYSDTGSTIGFELENRPESYTISIYDTGYGIDKNELDNIFELYYQVDDTHQKNGTGIGLYLVKELVNILNGQIDVSSTKDIGTLFTIKLPITRNAPTKKEVNVEALKWSLQESRSKEFNIPKSSDTNKNVVLIIDDNDDLRKILENLLSKKYEVISAENGQEGLIKSKQYGPDIILADVMMPIMDGLSFTREVKSDKMLDHIPIVLLTAKADQESINEGLRAGAEGYLTKPFDDDEVLSRLDNLISLKDKLKKKYGVSILTRMDKNKNDSQWGFISELNQIITENLGNEKFGIPELCSHLNTNHVTLNKKIKSLTGVTSSNYIKKFRLKVAYNLIVETDLHINEVSYKIGISDPTYFTKLFKTEYDILPSRLRESIKG